MKTIELPYKNILTLRKFEPKFKPFRQDMYILENTVLSPWEVSQINAQRPLDCFYISGGKSYAFCNPSEINSVYILDLNTAAAVKANGKQLAKNQEIMDNFLLEKHLQFKPSIIYYDCWGTPHRTSESLTLENGVYFEDDKNAWGDKNGKRIPYRYDLVRYVNLTPKQELNYRKRFLFSVFAVNDANHLKHAAREIAWNVARILTLEKLISN